MGGVKAIIGRFNSSRNRLGSFSKDNLLIFGLILFGLMIIFSYGMDNVSAASGDSIYVSSSGNDDYNGLNSTWTGGLNGPKATIENATGTIKPNGTVHIARGTYNESNIQINTDMIIMGENQVNTIINGNQSGNSIFTIAMGVNLTIINLTLTNATAKYGAIENNGILTVSNSTFRNNNATIGGGAINNFGTLTVVNGTFTNNTATSEGGALDNNGPMAVYNSTFTSNSANYGGAIDNHGTFLTVDNSTFTNNNAPYGGAIVNYRILTVNNSAFTNNNAAGGGAIMNFVTLTVDNSTFTNNTASYYGGAIDNYGTVVVNFNRIIGNTAPTGSAIHSSVGTVDARYNWWGSNTDPSANINGTGVTYDPWIVLSVPSNPTNINVNGKSTITVDLLHDFNGVYHDPLNGHVPDGLIVNFSSDTKGAVNPINSTITNGSTTTTFTGLQPGISKLLTTIDDQTETTNVNINTPTAIVVNHISGLKGDKINLTANLTDTYKKVPISGKTIQFSVNGNIIGTAVTDSNGIATLAYTITQTSGSYTILAEFAGDTTYSDTSNTNTLKVTNLQFTIIPTAKASPDGGLYNTTKLVTLTMNEPGIIYYTTNGSTPTTTSNLYTGPITIKSTTTLKYLAVDLLGNMSIVYNATYIIDRNTPTVNVNVKSGLYNTTKTVKLIMNENGTIYYTLSGKTPTICSNKYNGPITIKSTSTLKYLAVDLAGNKSPVYTKTYTIDKLAPKPVKTAPTPNTKNVSLTAPITIKFNENISKSVNFSKIYIRNISTGKIAKSTVTNIKGNTITLKMIKSRLSLNNYQVVIPTGSVKDSAGNKNTIYKLNFKTSKY